MQDKKNPFVIIRALGDEPVRLRAVSVSGNAVVAFGSDERTPMPFHLYRAYNFEQNLFGSMRSAFEDGQAETLAALWSRASPFAPEGRTEG